MLMSDIYNTKLHIFKHIYVRTNTDGFNGLHLYNNSDLNSSDINMSGTNIGRKLIQRSCQDIHKHCYCIG